MTFPIAQLQPEAFPRLLCEIPHVPKALYYRGRMPDHDMKLLSVVGSRKYSTYGKQVVDHLIGGLRGYNIGIVSGLALGIDSLAHESALTNNLYTLAVPGSGLNDDVIYPASHRMLARKILENNGGLLSEFEPTFTATKWSFTQRNRIMAGIADATLVIEASEKSGTLITARMATDYNRELLVVPGSIFSTNSAGPHQFLRLGATPVTCSEDILYALRINPEDAGLKPKALALHNDLSEDERKILSLLIEVLHKDALIRLTNLPAHEANVLLMQMEFKGLIKSDHDGYKAVS